MFGKIAVRNIPADIWAGLESLAARHDRSVEAEARYALRAWVEPLTQTKESSARRTEVAARLRDLLGEVNGTRHNNIIKLSHLAQAIGEQHAEPLEKWFAAEREPTFEQLDKIATYLGSVPAWLQHGDGRMFPVTTTRIPEGPAEGAAWFLDEGLDEQATFVRIVREAGQTGSLAVIKQYGDWRCRTFHTPYHISEEIGAGGESSLAHLTVTFELLYKKYAKARSNLVIKSYILQSDGYAALMEGKEHPLSVLQRYRNVEAPWWEDIFDGDARRQDYWPGWTQLCARMRRCVEQKKYLHAQRELIKSGEHPALSVPA